MVRALLLDTQRLGFDSLLGHLFSSYTIMSSILDRLARLTDLEVIYRKEDTHRYRGILSTHWFKKLRLKEADLDMTTRPRGLCHQMLLC